MEFQVEAINPGECKAEALVVCCFEKEPKIEGCLKDIDHSLDGKIQQLITQGEIKAKDGEVTTIHSFGKIEPQRVLITGLGKREQFKADVLRRAMANACRALVKIGVTDVAVSLPGNLKGIESKSILAQLVAEGFIFGNWSFKKYVTNSENHNKIEKITLLSEKQEDIATINEGIFKGKVLAEAANFARDMINEPANYMIPEQMAMVANDVAKENNLEIDVMEVERMEEMEMEAIMAVARGSCNPPKFIVIKYKGRSSEEVDLALVGKAVTFDSGGISIKPSEKMEQMKMDMAGGASVIAAINAISRLKPAINVVALVAAVENLPDGKAQRPGDVVKTMSGKTVEVISTDAEGRMTMADVLTYAGRMGAKYVVDVATLTGACVIALGEVATGVFTNKPEFGQMVVDAGEEAGEYMWQMPMFSEYREQYKSDIADMKNAGGRDAGAITAALFLSEFVGDNPWVHLDIAGTAMISKDRGYWKKGGTGVPVRTLTNLAMNMAEKIK